LTTNLVVSLKPDTHTDRAKQDLGIDEPNRCKNTSSGGIENFRSDEASLWS